MNVNPIPTYKFQVKAVDNPRQPTNQRSVTADVIVSVSILNLNTLCHYLIHSRKTKF